MHLATLVKDQTTQMQDLKTQMQDQTTQIRINSQGAASNGENSTQSNASQRKDDPKAQMQVQYENPETNVTATITGSFDDEDQ